MKNSVLKISNSTITSLVMEGQVKFPLLPPSTPLVTEGQVKFPLLPSPSWLRKDKLNFPSCCCQPPWLWKDKLNFPSYHHPPGYGRTGYISPPAITPLVTEGQVTFLLLLQHPHITEGQAFCWAKFGPLTLVSNNINYFFTCTKFQSTAYSTGRARLLP